MSLSIHPCYPDKGTNSTNNPLNWGHLFLTRHINSLTSGLGMFLRMLPLRGGVTFNLVGTNQGALMPLGDPKILAMSLSREDSTPPNKVDLPQHTPTNPKQGDKHSSLAKRARIPNRGCTNNRTSFILECLMVFLGYTETNIPIIRIPRTYLHQQSCHFWQP